MTIAAPAAESGSERQLVGDGAWIAFGQAISLLAKLVGIRCLTELYTPTSYGAAGVLLAALALLLATAATPLCQGYMRLYGPARNSGGLAQLVYATRRLLLIGVGAQCVVLWLVIGWLGIAMTLPLAAGAAALVAADSLRTLRTDHLGVAGAARLHALWLAAEATAKPAMACLFALLFTADPASLLFGYACGGAAVYWLFSRRADAALPTERPGMTTVSVPWRRQLLEVALAIAPLAPFAWLLAGADRIALAQVATAHDVGVYLAAAALGATPFIAVTAVCTTVLRPALYRAIDARDRLTEARVLRQWLIGYSGMACAGLAALGWLAEPIVGVLLAADYAQATQWIPWVGAVFAVQGVQPVFETRLLAWHRPRLLWIVHLLAGGVALLGYLTLVPVWVVPGALLALGGGVCAGVGCAALLAQRAASRGTATPRGAIG